jgi:hypothetical protein
VIKPSGNHYAESILGLILIVEGVALIWPGQQLPNQDAYILLSSVLAEHILGLWQIISGVLIVVGVSAVRSRISYPARRIGTFGAFLALSFITFLGIASKEGNQIYWIATVGLALMSAVFHIRAGWKDE